MSQSLRPGQHIGSYRVVRQLGTGGMGAVYEAVHTQIERRVAIKVLHARLAYDRDLAERFLNEARAVNIIQHPNLISIFDMGRLSDGAAYMVMEYLPGQTLTHRLLWGGGRLGLATLLFARQIAAGLAAAHDKGIIHRDLKPDNVMVIGDPEMMTGERIKILDFGIAKLTDDARGPDARRTEAMQTMGTPVYMAPEQWVGANLVDAKADVYSLGVILYQLLAGHVPFRARTFDALRAQHLAEQPRWLLDVDPCIPAELAQLVHAMLAKEPGERPTMRQVTGTLERITSTPSPIAIASKLRQRKLLLVSALSIVLALTMAGVVLALVLSR